MAERPHNAWRDFKGVSHFEAKFFRPPDIHVHVGGLIIYRDSSFYLRQLHAELAERNSTMSGHMVGSKCNLKIHVQNLRYPLPYKSGAQKPLFGTISQLSGDFNSLYLRNETRYRQSGNCVDIIHGVSYTSCQNMSFGLLTASSWTLLLPLLPLSLLKFYQLYVNSAFYFIARFRRRRSANGTQPNFAKRRMVNPANNLR